MRYLILSLLGNILPHRAWMMLPLSWRDWWAAEWVRRYHEAKP